MMMMKKLKKLISPHLKMRLLKGKPQIDVYEKFLIRHVSTSFYDSQSGKMIEYNNAIKIINADSQDLKYPEELNKTSSKDIPVLLDIISLNEIELQTLSANLADNGYNKLILGGFNINDEEEIDIDDINLAIEACNWNDVEGLPMKQRLGIIPNTLIQLEDFLTDDDEELNFKYIYNSSIPIDQLETFLKEKNIEYIIDD